MPISPAPIQTLPTNKQTGLTSLAWAQWFNQVVNGPSWISWTPAISASGSMTVSGVTINDAQYSNDGATVRFKLYVSLTLGGTADFFVYFTLPIPLAGSLNAITAYLVTPTSGTFIPAFGRTDSSVSPNRLLVRMPTNASFTLGSSQFLVEGFYRSA